MDAANSSERARVLLADDHVLVAQGIEMLLLECFCNIRIVSDGQSLVDEVRRDPPDVIVSDISMTGMSGLDAMRALRGDGIEVPFVFLTMHADPELAAEAIEGGASAYVLKSSAGEELVRAIFEVLAGRTYVTPTLAARTIRASAHRAHGGQSAARSMPDAALTQKQREILARVAQGLRSKQIAFELGLSVRTVESHKYAIMQEFGVHSTVELVRKAAHAGLIAIDAPP
ncbi:response regulator transcription factor [Noviluteimonas dokdonensis]|uniref:response regulator transcription factor n=1 Tax=Noviluteimonas dokdonensis TaxID=414050 RepID=UPI0005690909|nr:response regulator transcription factor [Lysobacter dokdonensis]